MPIAWHLIQRLSDDRVLVRNTSQRRIYADTVLRLGKECGVFTFGLPDNHSHVGLECDRATVGRFAQRLGVGLRRNLELPVAFGPARFVEIKDQRHLCNAFDYMLSQASHHGVDADPFLEATALPDLLGLRVNGSWLAGRVKALLPRVTRADLLSQFGIDALDPADALEPLAEAAASALALPNLEGRERAVVEARCAAIRVAKDARLPTAEIARLLGIHPRTVQMLALRETSPRLVRAIRLQLGLRARVSAAPTTFEPDEE